MSTELDGYDLGNRADGERGMVDVLVYGAEGEISRYPAEDGGRSQNLFRPITARVST